MSYTSENNSPPGFSLEKLVQKNSQSLETLEREPYKRIQAEQAGADIGAALGLAVGAVLALSKSEEVQEETHEHTTNAMEDFI